MYSFILTLIVLLIPAQLCAENISLLVIDNNSCLVEKAVAGLDLPAGIKADYFSAAEIRKGGDELRGKINESKIILVDVMGRELEEYLLAKIDLDGKTIYGLRGSTDDERLKKRGFLFDEEVAEYFRHLSKANIRNMLRLVAKRHFDSEIIVQPVVPVIKQGIYHPDSQDVFTNVEEYLAWYKQQPGFAKEKPWLGILFFYSSLTEGQRQPIEFTTRSLEEAGFNIMPCFGRDQQTIEQYLLDKQGRSRVDIILAYSLKFYSALTPDLARDLAALDVPIINGVSLYKDTVEQWRQSQIGIGANAMAWAIVAPELSGLIEPTVLTAKKEIRDPATGKVFYINEAVAENLERLIPRLHNWVNLQRKNNSDKKVAILFYNHHQGKQNIGASYLNVFRSLKEIIYAMHDDGYTTGKPLTEEKIKKMILASARNIGSWAPGELDRMLNSGEVVRLSVMEYKKWFGKLPEDFQEKVVRQWGSVEESTIMIKDGNFIIPAVRLGNIILLPEPSRGWGDDPMKLYHDTTLYPHHQYIAVYLWLQQSFQADSMIHLGTHATQEWTPGKQAGLSPSCSPEVLICDIPNMYPYIVDDVGEGIQAKRRGRGVIISHLTPMLKESGLYEEYSRMAELVNEYERAVVRNSATAPEKLKELFVLAKQTGILKDIQAAGSQDHEGDGELVHLLGHYLEDIRENLIPYGMHSFGRAPQEQEIAEMAKAVVKWNPEADEKEMADRLRNSGSAETRALLKGLNGRYVVPGEGNDPIRNPSSLPTGKNFYGFNPTKLPSPAAWKLGKKAAEEIIANHLAKEDHYPNKVAVVLWATEILRNEGVNESTILWLMGIKPVWSKTGRVVGVEPVPGRILGRPRIDVMINASGLYRDLFPDKMLFIDQAVQLAARQTDIENLIARHNQRIKSKLIKDGMSEKEAEELSRLRVFAAEPGSYGTGVAQMASGSGMWEKPEEVVDVYENRVGFAYGGGKWGISARNLLKHNLAGVDVAVHSRSSNVYGLLDNDDMFQYLGALSMAVAREAGDAPETLIIQQNKPGRVHVEDVAKTLGREMRSRYFNPKWIEAMKKEDYAGAREMSHYVEYLWGWQVTTPDKVDAAKWQQTYEVYVEDKYGMELKKFFNKASPWAYQSITARMLETVRKGYWQADDKIQQKLAAVYAVSVIEKGVACCDHTCNNPMLNQMVVSIISLPGVMTPEMVEKFKLAIEQMAGKSTENQAADRKELQKQLTAPTGDTKESQQTIKETGVKSEAQAESEVEGYKMEKIKSKDETTQMTSSGVEWLAGLTVLLIIGLAAYGAGRKR